VLVVHWLDSGLPRCLFTFARSFGLVWRVAWTLPLWIHKLGASLCFASNRRSSLALALLLLKDGCTKVCAPILSSFTSHIFWTVNLIKKCLM
jgi:hypothetical protein